MSCRAYGFYPRAISVSWLKDGEVRDQETEWGSVAPNSDGTYYTWASIDARPEEKDKYRCRVEHASLLEPGLHAWGEPRGLGHGERWAGGFPFPSSRPFCPPETESNRFTIVVAVAVAVAVLALIAAIAAFVMWKQKSGKALGLARQRGVGGRQGLGCREGPWARAAALWGAPKPSEEAWWVLMPLSLCREEGLRQGAK